MNNILINGINYPPGDPLPNDMDEKNFLRKILKSLTKRDRELQSFYEKNEKVKHSNPLHLQLIVQIKITQRK